MTTQTRKPTKAQRLHELFTRIEALGFTFEEAQALRRIEMTLHRWAELECGDSNDYQSWAIERDEKTEKPFMVIHPHHANYKSHQHPIADREKGALKRLAAIVNARNNREPEEDIIPYHQTDPRGCALYLLKASDVEGRDISCIYSSGVAVCE